MTCLFNKLVEKQEKISLVGLGYVGMPIAVAFSKKVDVIGFDVNEEKINLYKQGIDPTNEVGNDTIKNCNVVFTSDEEKLKEAKFHIVAVPTPINSDKSPNLFPVESASRTLGRNLTKGSIVVFESTVYPGVTEDTCIPILEKESGLKCGIDFKVGYSPERINPGDKTHTLENIIKIVSGMDEESLNEIAETYKLVVKAGVYKAESIKVAEAAKVIENSQRDINIAFMNELSIIFNKLGIDTKAVLAAAGTKWNFLNFFPGLVGGHCIGVDPYYLAYKAEQEGIHSSVIMSGRRINDDMGKYIAENIIKHLAKTGKNIRDAKIAVLGFTFKENCPDTRNTRVIDIINELKEYGVSPKVVDPIASAEDVYKEYGLKLNELEECQDIDVLVIATAHDEYKEITLSQLKNMLSNEQSIIFDIKGILNKDEVEKYGHSYWRL